MKKKVTIIVPVYNVEKYIDKCLNSLVNQDYDNYDILVINDGSPYNEQAIIDTYVKKYPKKVRCIKKENGGYGSGLEVGIKESKSEFILVCDSDDYLTPNAISTLVKYQEDTNADIVVGAKTLVFEDNDTEEYDYSYNSEFGTLKDKEVYSKGSKAFETLYFLEPSPHAKLYKRSLVEKTVFPHKISFTDNVLYFCALTKANRVTYCEEALSYYLINRTGNTSTDLKPTVIDALVKAFSSIVNQVKDADDIFYYRMFESFYFIFYQVDRIKASKEEKYERYELVYSFLKLLIPHYEAILKYNDEYQHDNNRVLTQKKNLLSVNNSKAQFDELVRKKLNPSILNKVLNFIRS